MKSHYSILLYFFLFFLKTNFLYSQSASFNAVYNQLANLQADQQKIADVSNLVIKRDACTFNLISGKIYSTTPIDKNVRALVFIGNGTYSFIPGNDLEKNQLKRFFGVKELDEKINYLVMFFADSSYDELKNTLSFVPGTVPNEVTEYLENGLDYLLDRNAGYANSSFMLSLLDDERNDFFISLFKSKKNGELLFNIDPFSEEEISLLREKDSPKISVSHALLNLFQEKPLDMNYSEVICSFRKKDKHPDDYKAIYIKDNRLDLLKYQIEVKIDDRGNFSAEAEVFFNSNVNGGQWIDFNLYNNLIVDSVISGGGKKIEFSKGENSPVLWIKSPVTFQKDGKFSLKIYYRGDILFKIEEYTWLIIKDANNWYPRYGNRESSLFEITYHSPTKYLLASVGNKVSETQLEGVTTTKWVTDKQIRNASFNLGFFKEVDFDGEGFPNVKVLVGADGHGNKAEDRAEDVGADIVNSLQFFTNLYGSLEIKDLYATEIIQSHGEAFSGLVHLGGSTFDETNWEGYDQVFRAHEVAHQWWGIGIDYATYHDKWLSEALSEYSGLFYMQTILKDNNKLFKLLDRDREYIISGKNYLFAKGIEPGPISLGYRNNTTDTQGDFQRIVYYKGAWVFHMLRIMMLDLKTMNEDKFKNMMKDFFTKNYGKKISTQDFQKEVEKYTGTDMSWFFDQWVYGTDIPKYKFAYKTERNIDGKFHAVCRINSTGLPDDFKTNLVLKIVFPNNQYARLRITMIGNHYEFKLPHLPTITEEIILNDLNSVLCEVESVDWE